MFGVVMWFSAQYVTYRMVFILSVACQVLVPVAFKHVVWAAVYFVLLQSVCEIKNVPCVCMCVCICSLHDIDSRCAL